MFEWHRNSRVVLAVFLALATIGVDTIFSQGRSTNRRTAIIDGREVVEGEVIVRYRSQSGHLERERAEFQAASDTSETIGRRGARRLRSRKLSTRQMIAALRANPDVALVEPNYIIRATAMPNDASMSQLWGLLNTGQNVDGQNGVPGADINAVEAWDVTTGSRANIVAIIDTGIDFNHPDLAANLFTAPRQFTVQVGALTVTCLAGTHGFNALTNSCTPFDDNGHGTHVAGIVGAVGNNSIGVTGVNWTANLMGLKVLGADGTGTTSDAIKAIDFAIKAKAALGVDGNVRVLNASWGGGNFSQALNDEIAAANNANMLFVAAAGSDGHNNDVTPHYPASSSSSNVLSVAAADNTGNLGAFSNYGATSVHLAAPGGTIVSTLPANSYGELGGTSMAAAFVSGAAALILSDCPINTTALKSRLLASVDPVASLSGKTVSGGRLNVNNAVRGCAPASITVNGSASPVSVAPGATLTIAVANGPANIYDWVTIAPAGSSDTTYTGIWFLNGTSSPPASGLPAATFAIPAPSTAGSYEARFLDNGRYQRLATSALITVGSGAPPPPPPAPLPVLTSISPVSVGTNAAFVLTATGSGFATNSQIVLNGVAKATTFVSSTTLTAAIAASDVAAAGSRSVTVVTPAPGGGTSAALALAVVGAAGGPTISVNGSTGAVSVVPGATMTIAVANGPAHVYDWVTIVPVGSANNAYTGIWFLNGTSTPPASGVSSATFAVPASATPGTFEARFLATGGYTRLATSGVITVGSVAPPPPPPPAPVPVLASISPVSVGVNAAFVLTATGSSFTANSQILLNGVAKTTTFVSNTTLTAAIAASDVATAGSRNVSVVTPAPGGGTSAALALTVAAGAPTSGPKISVNGSTAAVSVAPGATMTIAVANGPAHVYDWVTVVPVGSADNAYTGIWFLNGTSTPPASGLSSATFAVPASTTPGTYEARFLASGRYTRLATSGVITVGTAPPPPPPPPSPAPAPVLTGVSPASVSANAAFVLTATGSGFAANSQILVNGAARTTTYVSSTTLTAAIPGSDVATVGSVSITVLTPAPGGGTSAAATLTVVAATGPTFTVNGSAGALSVAPGATMAIAIAGGPGHVYDWVTIVPVGSADNAYTGVWFLNGTSTPPASGLMNATFGIPAPTAPGNYEARFLASGRYGRLATSGVITVGTGAPPPPPPPPPSTGATIAVNGLSGAVSVARGASMTISVANGPGSNIDWVTIVPVGSPDNVYNGIWFLNGTSLPPSTGVTSATFVVTAPTTAGSYEARFLASGRYTRLATSGVVTVTP